MVQENDEEDEAPYLSAIAAGNVFDDVTTAASTNNTTYDTAHTTTAPSLPIVSANNGTIVDTTTTITTTPPMEDEATTTTTTNGKFEYSRIDTIVTCILVVLIALLSINLLVLVYKPIRRFLRRRYRNLEHVQEKRKERRYATIDQWLVTKVRIYIYEYENERT